MRWQIANSVRIATSWLITHDGETNDNSLIALSNDPVINYLQRTFQVYGQCCHYWTSGVQDYLIQDSIQSVFGMTLLLTGDQLLATCMYWLFLRGVRNFMRTMKIVRVQKLRVISKKAIDI